jgi:hypothetical protein
MHRSTEAISVAVWFADPATLNWHRAVAGEMPEKVAEMKQRLAEFSRSDRDAVAND